MSKQAVQVELAYVDDPKQVMKFVGVLEGGRLTSVEMFGYASEYEDGSAHRKTFPFIMDAQTDDCLQYTVSWGAYNEAKVDVEFAPRPLMLGQEVIRTDYEEKKPDKAFYKILSITPLA